MTHAIDPPETIQPQVGAFGSGQDLEQARHARLPLAMRRAEETLARVTNDPAADRMLNRARTARSTAQRFIWLQQTASACSRSLSAIGR